MYRSVVVLATFAAIMAVPLTSARAGHGHQHADDCEHCGALHHHGCGCGCGHHKYIEGRDPWFNCGCSGSYKYPVPPLYTYHWPGMYSQPTMTEYRSPWRFPPLRPYTEESTYVVPAAASREAGTSLRRVSYQQASDEARVTGEPEPLSSKLDRLSR